MLASEIISKIVIKTLLGEAIGHLANKNGVKSFLVNYGADNDAREWITAMPPPISFLDEIFIYPKFQNHGYGKKLLNQFLVKSFQNGASCVILVARSPEDGEEYLSPIKLYRWYEKNGFIRIGDTFEGDPIFFKEI